MPNHDPVTSKGIPWNRGNTQQKKLRACLKVQKRWWTINLSSNLAWYVLFLTFSNQYLFNPCEMPSKHPMLGVYVAIAPSWWGTKHSSHVRKTNDAHRINSNVDRVHQWLQCAVFWKEEQKTSENYDIYDPIKKGYCILCTKLPFLPLNTSNFLKRSNHIIFF